MRLVRLLAVDAEPGGAQPLGHRRGVGLVVEPHRQHPGLHGRHPRREGAGVVLDEDAEEPLHRPEQGAVDHDRLVAGVVGPGVLETEPLRLLEVALEGG
jgi:hypothetical protein